MKAKELMEELAKVPDDTEIALWIWDGMRSTFRQLGTTASSYNEKKKIFAMGTMIPETLDPIYLDNLPE
jgi:hypothetical protein